jgi:hypothetical protein
MRNEIARMEQEIQKLEQAKTDPATYVDEQLKSRLGLREKSGMGIGSEMGKGKGKSRGK